MQAAQAALTAARQSQNLPDDYVDVTEGRLARWKRWVKRKLLNNFKHAYVDVLSRQQSRVNQQLVATLHQLTECCTTLDHAVRVLQERVTALEEQNEEADGPSQAGLRAVTNLPEQLGTLAPAIHVIHVARGFARIADGSMSRKAVQAVRCAKCLMPVARPSFAATIAPQGLNEQRKGTAPRA